MRYLLGLPLLLAACATATTGEEIVDAKRVDAKLPLPDGATGVDSATTVDARPDAPPAPPDACVPAPRELLQNGNLEAVAGWNQQPSNAAFPIITTAPTFLTAPSPTQIAWQGGALSATDQLWQQFTVPAGATNLTVSLKYQIGSEEITFITAYDKLTVTLRDSAGAVLTTVGTLSNLNENTAFTIWNRPIAQAYAGQTLRLVLASTTDVTNNTNFFVDDISVTATSCP